MWLLSGTTRRARELVISILTSVVLGIAANSLPLIFNVGVWSGDLEVHHAMAFQFYQSLTDGNPYPRWMPIANVQLGDFSFYYYAPLFFYVTAALRLVVSTTWDAMLWSEVVSYAATGLAAFWIIRPLGSLKLSLAAQAVMIFSPQTFMLFNSFISVATGFAVPAVVTALGACASVRTARIDRTLALSVCAAIMSHTITGLICLVCLPFFAFSFFLPDRTKLSDRLLKCAGLLVSIGLGVGIAMVYLLPAFSALPFVHAEAWNELHGAFWKKCFIFPIVTSRIYGMNWPAVQWILAFAAVFPLAASSWDVLKWRGRDHPWKAIAGLIFVGWVSVFFASELSYPLWATLKPLRNIQHPYRFFVMTTACGLLANLLCITQRATQGGARRAYWLAAPIAASVLLWIALFAQIALRDGVAARRTDSAVRTDYGMAEYVPHGAGPRWREYRDKGGLQAECAAQDAECRSVGTLLHPAYVITLTQPARIRLPLFSFPAWSLSVDGRDWRKLTDSESGLLALDLPAGSHQIVPVLNRLPAEGMGLALTVIALVVTLFGNAVLGRISAFVGRATRESSRTYSQNGD